MRIVESVVDGFAVSSEFYELHLLQDAQLMRDRALGHAQQLSDITDAQLPAGQSGENPDAGRIAEGLEKLGKAVQNF